MNKLAKRLTVAVVTFVLSFTVMACSTNSGGGGIDVIPTVSLNKLELALKIGDAATLKVTATPDASKVELSSSKPEIATVNSDGVVTAIAEGVTVITAKNYDAIATCEVTVSKVIPPIERDPTRIPEPTEGLLDNFEQGIDYDKWGIMSSKWGAAPAFKGCFPDNVKYTEDGILMLEAKGGYYPTASKQVTGGTILSRDAYGPGKYEIAMKISPRLGMCTAMWTYFNDGIVNHEIDIEFPGRPTGTVKDMGLDYVLNTNWKTEEAYTTEYKKLTDFKNADDKNLTPANDGEWHKFRFDWDLGGEESKEPGRAEVRYYYDDVLTATITNNIPTIMGQLWIGIWQPNNWAGVADFEQADMLVDWVSYVPYETEATLSKIERKGDVAGLRTEGLAGKGNYPTAPSKLNKEEIISNGNMSGVASAWNIKGHEGSKIYATDYLGKEKALKLKDTSTATQIITAVYENYEFTFDGETKLERITEGGTAKLKFEFVDSYSGIGGNVLKTETIDIINAADFIKIAKTIKAPARTKALRIVAEVNTIGETIGAADSDVADGMIALFDNFSLKFNGLKSTVIGG